MSRKEEKDMQELVIHEMIVRPGKRASFDIPLPSLYTHAPVPMTVHVIHGRRDGPRLLVCAAVHGDEINGIEIIRRLIRSPMLKGLRGTLIAVPIVNVYGFVRQSRYLPDRRDLNRCFPGTDKGSLAARLAHLFTHELLTVCTHGIDLHTGAIHRDNLPQVRTAFEAADCNEALARAFGAPVILNADLRDGSLRAEAAERGIPFLVYEGGEALRYSETVIRAGVRGVFRVMRALGMVRSLPGKSRSPEAVAARSTQWVRSPQSGLLRALVPLGAKVSSGEVLGVVEDPFGKSEEQVTATCSGIVIGRNNLPLVTEGDALFHIARFGEAGPAAEAVEQFQVRIEEEMEEFATELPIAD
ncbi:MAG: succinylglutamate desuccinylase/aspartoacylase family protein [Methylohalobius sp. ZOD2]